ncbi:DUF4365 domain-containing protein, partial [Leptospira sp. id769339]|uniref:DUF4365 domain-containing protein n=1 Tax=Leptospira sp. id769339 TaxID=2864221 RepID=UPI00214C5893
MGKSRKEGGPKGYSRTDTAETESIRIFQNSVDYEIIKLDIKERDKFPNIDGYIEIVEKDQVPIGKMEVQIKTLPKGALSYTVDSSILAYANEVAILPLLLILVDRQSSIVYWILISKKINRPNLRISELEQINSGSDYINKWKSIIHEYRKRIEEHPRLKELVEVYKYTKPLEGFDSYQIQFLQKFIDQMNLKLDTDLRIVKDVLFPRVWKLGVAINSFKENFSIGLYAINYGVQDPVIIRSFEKGKFDIFNSKGMISMYVSSDIPDDPIKLANSKLSDYFKDFLESEMSPIVLKEFANEYVYSVVNKYYYAFGYKKQAEKYDL